MWTKYLALVLVGAEQRLETYKGTKEELPKLQADTRSAEYGTLHTPPGLLGWDLFLE